jgi:excisionase family DNA binding protein
VDPRGRHCCTRPPRRAPRRRPAALQPQRLPATRRSSPSPAITRRLALANYPERKGRPATHLLPPPIPRSRTPPTRGAGVSHRGPSNDGKRVGVPITLRVQLKRTERPQYPRQRERSKHMPSTTPFMNAAEVAQLLAVTPTRVRQLARSGLLPHVRRGRRLLVPREAWTRWLAAQADRALAVAPNASAPE